jgi:hypothetical protein
MLSLLFPLVCHVDSQF